MKKQEKKTLKLNKETLRLLSHMKLQAVVGGTSKDSCFPDICIELDSSGC